jgi:hypothetical protein
MPLDLPRLSTRKRWPALLVIAVLPLPPAQMLAAGKSSTHSATASRAFDDRASSVLSSITALTSRKPQLERYIPRRDLKLSKHVREWRTQAKSVNAFRSEVGDF